MNKHALSKTAVQRTAARLRATALALTVALTVPAVSMAQTMDPDEMTLDENLSYPKVPDKARNSIVRHIERIGNTFKSKGIEVKYTRSGEVADIVVPCSELFDPNSTELSVRAPRYLNALQALVKLPTLYKIVVVVHADDTGSAEYSDALTEERSDTIDEYLRTLAPDAKVNVIPYGMGQDEPRAANNSIAGRAANRRVEFYIVPESQTIDMAASGKL